MYSNPEKEQMSATVNEVSAVLKNLDKMRSMLDSKLATRFSIFSVIGELSEAEVSKILAHLLDPRGTHDAHTSSCCSRFIRSVSATVVCSFPSEIPVSSCAIAIVPRLAGIQEGANLKSQFLSWSVEMQSSLL